MEFVVCVNHFSSKSDLKRLDSRLLDSSEQTWSITSTTTAFSSSQKKIHMIQWIFSKSSEFIHEQKSTTSCYYEFSTSWYLNEKERNEKKSTERNSAHTSISDIDRKPLVLLQKTRTKKEMNFIEIISYHRLIVIVSL